jgi:hypothetical protein
MSDKLSATIEVGLDGSKVQEGVAPIARTIDNLSQVAKRANKETADSLGNVGEAGAAAATKIDRATNNMIGSIQRTTAAMESGSKSSAKYFEVLAQQRGINADVLRPYLEQLKAVEGAQKSVGISAAQTAAAMRNVPAQFTDIVTSIQGGQKPLTVFLQQGGQLKDMFGGAGNAARAMGSYLVGLINPITAAGAAVAALGYAYSQSNEQSQAFAKSIILSGNAAGTTTDQLMTAAQRISDVGIGSQSLAAEALNGLVSSGKVSMSVLDDAARAAIKGQQLLGLAVEDTVKAFSDLGKSPTKSIEALNEKYRFLTLEIYEQIKALEDQGKKADAARLAQETYANALVNQAGKVSETLTDWERGWIRIKTATSDALDAAKRVFDDPTADQKIAKLFKQREQFEKLKKDAEANGDTTLSARYQVELDQNERMIRILRSKVDARKEEAKAQEAANKQVQAGIEWGGVVEKNLSKEEKLRREIAKVRAAGIAAGVGEKEIEEQIAIIRKSGVEKALKAAEDQSLAWQVRKAEYKAMGDAEKRINEELTKSHTAYADAVKKNTKDIITGFTDQLQAENRLKSSLDDWARGYQESAELAKLELSLLGQSSTERATALAQYKIELELQKQLAAIENERALNKISSAGANEAKLKAEQIAADAKNLAGIKAQQETWTNFYTDIYNGLSDSLYRGFEAGKGFFESFWGGIKNLFKTTVLKLAIQGVLTGVIGGIAGNASAATNPLGQAFNAISTGKSLWEGFAAAGAASSGTFTSFAMSSLGQSLGLSSATTASALTAEAAALTGSTLGTASSGTVALTGAGSTGASIAGAMPYVAAAIAAFQGMKAINGEYRLNGVSADAGAAIFGIAPRLFGMKEKEFGGQTVTGTLGTDNLMRNQPWTQQGGLFRSDRSDVWSYGLKDSVATTRDGKSYTDTASLTSDKELLKLLNGSYDAVKTAAADFAKSLGLNADEIAKRNDSINLTLGKTQEETEKALAGVFGGIADLIAADLIPNIASLRKEGETSAAAMARLATGLVGVNQTISAIGLEKLSTSVVGAGDAQRLIELSGGFDKFLSGASFFAENFLSEAEKMKPAVDIVAETMARLGKSTVDTVPEFKNLVQSLDLSTESGAKMYAELIAIAPQFKAVTDYTASLNGVLVETGTTIKQAADVARERANLEEQLNALTDTGAQALARQREALDASNRGIFDQIQALTMQRQAEEAAAQRAAQVAQERTALQDQFNALTETAAQSLERQRAALDESNRGIFDQIQALKEKQDAEQQIAAIQKAASDERLALTSQLNELTMTSEQRLQAQRFALEQTNVAIFDQIQALTAQKAAEEAAAQRAAQIAQERTGLQDQLNGLTDTAAQALNRQREALDESNRGIFDQIQALGAQKQAEEAAAQKSAQVAQQRSGLQEQLNALTDTAAQSLERQRAALDASNVALFDQIQALSAQKAAEEAAAQRIAQVSQERAALQAQLNTLTDTAAQALNRQREALDESNRGIFDQIQALGAQKQAEEAAAQKSAQVAQERASLQDQLNALTDTAAQALNRQREALDASNRGIFDQVQALVAQKQAEEAAAQQAAAATQKATQIAQERIALQDQLNALTDSAAQALARQREALDASNQGIFDQIQALSAQKQAQEAATQKAAQVAQERGALQDQLNAITDTAAQSLNRQRAALDASNVAIFDQIQALTAQRQAEEAATQKAAQIAQERGTLQDQLNALTDTAAQALSRQREALDASNRGIFDQVQALSAQKAAEEAAAQRAAQVSQERGALQDQLNALTDTATQALARQREALDASNQGIFDQIQALSAQRQAEEAAAQRAAQVAQERVDLQDQLAALTGDSAQALARQREALDASNRGIFDQIQALSAQKQAQEQALAAQKQAQEEAAQRAAQIAQERAALQDRINGLTDTAAQALERQRAALDASNQGLFDQVQALTAQRQAEEAATQKAAQVAQERLSLQDQLNGMTGTATEALARQREALDASNRGIFDQIQALSAQRQAEEAAAQKAAQVAQERGTLQDQLNGLTDTAAQALARQRDALDASNRGIFDQIQALSAQKQAEDAAAQQAAQKATQIAQERTALQDQLNALTDTAVDALARQRAALDASNQGIFDQIQALGAQKQAEEAAAQKAAQVAQERTGLQDRLNGLTDSSTQALERQRAALDESNRGIFDQIQALTAQRQAEEAAAQRTSQIAQERTGLQEQLNALTDTAAQALTRQREALDASNQGIFDQIQAINAQRQAEAAAAQKAAQVAQERAGLQDQLNGLTDSAVQALARQRAALDESNRSIFDQIVAIRNQQQAAEDAKQATQEALGAVQKAIDTERTRVSVIKQAAQESVNSIKGVFGVLGDQIDSIYNSVDSTKALQAIAGNAFLDNALANAKATGYLPEQNQLASAIAAVRNGIASTEYTTQFEADRAALVMAGKLSQLQEIAVPQLNAAEQALAVANQQLATLDAQEALAKQQVDAINGVNNSVLSVQTALNNLAAAIQGRTPAASPNLTATPATTTSFDAPVTATLNLQNARLESLVESLTAEVQRLQEIGAIGNQNTRRIGDAVNGNSDAPMRVTVED